MAIVGRHNIAKMTSSTTGTGTLTLGTASAGCNTFANSGVSDGETVTYVIRDGADTEVGRGVYTSSGTTLTRAVVLSSTNGGSKISCTGAETVSVTYAAEDVMPFANFYNSGSQTVTDGTDDATLSVNATFVNQTSIVSLASNELTVAKKGIYLFYASVYIESATAFNGYVEFNFDGFYTQQGFSTAQGVLTTYLYIPVVTYQINSDGETVGPLLISNHLGSSIDASVQDWGLFKVANIV